MSEGIDWADIFLEARKSRLSSPTISPGNSGPLTNNYICTRCKNNKLSTSETKCWWCEEPIKLQKEINEIDPIWRI